MTNFGRNSASGLVKMTNFGSKWSNIAQFGEKERPSMLWSCSGLSCPKVSFLYSIFQALNVMYVHE